MLVHVVDPSAYTPPYDHALCRALGETGLDVELYTSRFAYGPVPTPRAYVRREFFYGASHSLGERARGPRSRAGLALKLAEHVPGMLRYRRAARGADIVHFQWLTVQQLDVHLLPRGRPIVLTAHDVLPREPRRGQRDAQRRLYDRVDAVIVHSEHGRARLVGELGVDPARVHVIAHGVLAPWLDEAGGQTGPGLAALARLPVPLVGVGGPVVLFFGLLRPYKGLDVLLEAWRGVVGAELWIVGMPRMDVAPLRAAAGPSVRFVEGFVADRMVPALFSRATLAVLPYREIDQSGVAFTALGAGTPMLLSDAGGFPELARTGAARVVAAGDAEALGAALRELLGDQPALARMAQAADRAARGPYAWDAIARTTRALYESLLERT
jgi:glycosyltransferase involved in cell wall biosynthesis